MRERGKEKGNKREMRRMKETRRKKQCRAKTKSMHIVPPQKVIAVLSDTVSVEFMLA